MEEVVVQLQRELSITADENDMDEETIEEITAAGKVFTYCFIKTLHS